MKSLHDKWPILALPYDEGRLTLDTGAPDVGIGCVLLKEIWYNDKVNRLLVPFANKRRMRIPYDATKMPRHCMSAATPFTVLQEYTIYSQERS